MPRDLRLPPITVQERQRLRAIRLDRGLTFEQMGTEIGLVTTTLTRVLDGTARRPRETTLYRLRQWLTRQEAAQAVQEAAQ
jgi:transcriptional regulator with XRE-family HTH domain